jgi:hypothetical protein
LLAVYHPRSVAGLDEIFRSVMVLVESSGLLLRSVDMTTDDHHKDTKARRTHKGYYNNMTIWI